METRVFYYLIFSKVFYFGRCASTFSKKVFQPDRLALHLVEIGVMYLAYLAYLAHLAYLAICQRVKDGTKFDHIIPQGLIGLFSLLANAHSIDKARKS